MEENTLIQSPSHSMIERIAFSILLGLIAVLPFFFIPSVSVSFQTAKGLITSVGVILSLAVFIISMIRDAKLTFSRNLLSLSLVLLPFIFLISALFTGANQTAFIGYDFEVGTVAFMFFGVVLTLLTAQLFQQKERGFYAYLSVVISFVVVGLFQVLRFLFGPEAINFGIFTSPVSNTIGNWNDLAIFFSATALLSLVTIEMMSLKKMFRFAAYVVFIVSLFVLCVVNFVTSWYVLGSFALVFFLFLASFDRFLSNKNMGESEVFESRQSAKKISWNSLVVLFLSLAFVFFGTSLGERISTTFDVASVEVRPSWGTTFSVIGDTLKNNLLLGVGPNNFSQAWLSYKPIAVNESVFWNTDFSAGIGLIPTFVVTTGILGLIGLLFFFVMYLRAGFKAIFNQSDDALSRYLVTSSFVVSLYLWVMSFVYVPSLTNVVLLFFFTGLFMASLYREKILPVRLISLENHPKASFVSVLVLVVVLIANVSLGYLLIQKSVALGYFQKSVLAAQETGDMVSAEQNMIKAIELGKHDLYYRGLSELNLIRVNQILSEEGATPESVREEFQLYIANSIENARVATQIAPKNYLNWLALARVYSALVPQPFAIPGAYDNAKKTYEEAQKVNPKSPLVPISLARLEVANGNLNAAREFVNQSIALKSNYADAHFLLAQIEVTQGNIDKAIPSLERTLILSPENPGLFFQLGLLKYNDRDWNGSIQAFGQALQLVPEYANAKYFLGLSYFRAGDTEKAIEHFKSLSESNPENQEVKLILSNLEAKKDPFTDAEAPITNRPERRAELPISEEN